jgi:hypothetical protein
MTIEMLSGDAAVNAASDGDFAGFRNPRAFTIGESTQARVNNLMSAAFSNQWGASVRLAEAFSTSDFSIGAAAELDKEMLAKYEELPSTWDQYTDVTGVRDFRPKRLRSRTSTVKGMPRVPELTEYPAGEHGTLTDNSIAVFKYGRRFAISWEAWLNNEAIDELEDLPAVLAQQARETEAIAAVANLLAVDPVTQTANGANTDFFKAGNNNTPDNKALTRDNLVTVMNALASKKSGGRVVPRPEMVLVVPQALKTAANGITTPIWVRETVNNVTVERSNEFSNLTVAVDPTLDYINTHAKAATTWFLLPKPGSSRPASWVARLKGHEQPDLRIKSGAGRTLGGGEVNPIEGGFEVDDIQFRGRHVVGNQVGDPTFAYCSYGS